LIFWLKRAIMEEVKTGVFPVFVFFKELFGLDETKKQKSKSEF